MAKKTRKNKKSKYLKPAKQASSEITGSGVVDQQVTDSRNKPGTIHLEVIKKVDQKKQKNSKSAAKAGNKKGLDQSAAVTKNQQPSKSSKATPVKSAGAAKPESPSREPGAVPEKTSKINESVKSVKHYLWKELFDFEIDHDRYTHIRENLWKLFKIGGTALIATIAVSAIMVALDLHANARVLQGTTVGGVKVGNIPFSKAKTQLLAEIDNYSKTPLTFEYQGTQATLTPEDLGIKFKANETAFTMPVFSFRNDTTFKLAAALLTKRDLPVLYSIDREKIQNTLEKKFNLTGLKPHNASIAFQDNKYVIIPEKSGQVIDQTILFGMLASNLRDLDNQIVKVKLQDKQPSVIASQLEAQKDRLVALLQNSLTLKNEKAQLNFKPIEHLDAIDFVHADNGETINVKLVSSVITPYLEEKLLKEIEVPTSPVNIYQDKDGKVVIEGKAEDGWSVSRPELLASITDAINTGKKDVAVPVAVEKAPVTISDSLKELGIKELLATGHSAYYGSPANRMHNIKLGVSKYNGLILAPGEEFSFNKFVGEVDGKNGFKPEKVIKQNKIELEMGGGLCQVSTTVYRAALIAGFPITERAPHSWKVSYYAQSMGNGLDATVYTGSRDLKFINDTPGSLLIQSYVEGSEAYFKFYGTNDGRVVKLDGPYGKGLNYKWYRLLTKNNVETKETIVSNYKPVPPTDQQTTKPAETKPAVVAQTLTN